MLLFNALREHTETYKNTVWFPKTSYCIALSNVAPAVTHLTSTQVASGSNPGQDTEY
jgi:hypothetical protein